MGKTSCEASSSTSAARGSLPPAAIASAGTGKPHRPETRRCHRLSPAARQGEPAGADGRRVREGRNLGWAVWERCRAGTEGSLSSAHGGRYGGCKKARLPLWGTEGGAGETGRLSTPTQSTAFKGVLKLA